MAQSVVPAAKLLHLGGLIHTVLYPIYGGTKEALNRQGLVGIPGLWEWVVRA